LKLDKIKQNWKFKVNQGYELRETKNQRTKVNLTKTTPFWGWLFFSNFCQKSCSSGLLPKAFYVLSLYQLDKTCMKMITWHLTTPLRDLFWLIDAIEAVAAPQSDHPDQPISATKLTAHDSYFEPMVGIHL